MRICNLATMDFECGESLLLLCSKEVYCASLLFPVRSLESLLHPVCHLCASASNAAAALGSVVVAAGVSPVAVHGATASAERCMFIFY